MGATAMVLRTLGVALSELPRAVNEGSCGEGHPGDPHGCPTQSAVLRSGCRECPALAGLTFSQVTVCSLPWPLGWSAGFACPRSR